jgi:hypothetical protein
MDNLLTWAVWIAAAAVGAAPGVAIFRAPTIARLLRRLLSARPVVAPKLERKLEPRHQEPAGAPG